MSGIDEGRVGEWLLKCAVGRRATHYEREFSDDLPSDNPALSDEALGVALCLGQHDLPQPLQLLFQLRKLTSKLRAPFRFEAFEANIIKDLGSDFYALFGGFIADCPGYGGDQTVVDVYSLPQALDRTRFPVFALITHLEFNAKVLP